MTTTWTPEQEAEIKRLSAPLLRLGARLARAHRTGQWDEAARINARIDQIKARRDEYMTAQGIDW